MLELKNISVRYGLVQAVRQANFTLASGGLTILDGHHGAGKSSLLKAIVGAVRSEGEIIVDGRPGRRRTPALMLRRGVVLAPEGRHLFASLTTRENLEFGSAVSGARGQMDRVLALFPELGPLLNAPAYSLSGGQAQMLAFGRGVMTSPKYLLLDEPLLGLSTDPGHRVWEGIAALRRDGVGVLVTGQHNVPDNADSSQFFSMVNGQLKRGRANEMARE